jgi:hypothetical protein
VVADAERQADVRVALLVLLALLAKVGLLDRLEVAAGRHLGAVVVFLTRHEMGGQGSRAKARTF